MRDLALLVLLTVGCLYTFRQPWFGAVLWTFVSVMNPHRQAFGFMYDAPVAAAVGGVALLAWLVTPQKRNPFVEPSVVMLVIFMAWVCIVWPFSFDPDASREMLVKVLKIDLMIIISISILIEKKHIHWFIVTIVVSLVFYGVKGGIYTILQGGGGRVWGPGGFIGGNNEIALALITVIPLTYYLHMMSRNRWLRLFLVGCMVLTAFAALGSQSRGALVGISGMTLLLWLRSEKKVGIGIVLAAVAVAALAFMPDSWTERMHTIKTYEEDGSAMGRINAWIMCFNLANDKLLGGGFEIYDAERFAAYAPDPLDIHAAHSIYFQVLGEQGWIGLAIWLGIWIFTWRGAEWLRKTGKESPETMWCSKLGAMCQVSLVGFGIGGAFLSLAYFDLPYNIMVVVVCAKQWLMRERRKSAVSTKAEAGSGLVQPGPVAS